MFTVWHMSKTEAIEFIFSLETTKKQLLQKDKHQMIFRILKWIMISLWLLIYLIWKFSHHIAMVIHAVSFLFLWVIRYTLTYDIYGKTRRVYLSIIKIVFNDGFHFTSAMPITVEIKLFRYEITTATYGARVSNPFTILRSHEL